MSATDWTLVRHFVPREFDSPDLPDSGRKMQKELVDRLDLIRDKTGVPMVITSGYRTNAHNEEVGGVNESAHLTGYAADVACNTSQYRMKLIRYAIDLGINRIGVYKSFVHLDCHPYLPKNVMWLG